MNFDSQNVFLEVEDYSVSHQKFTLLYNEEYDILKTDPQPSAEQLPKYYESEDYISHTDGTRTLFEKVYQVVKTKNNSDKVKLITRTNNGAGRVLDIGCGTGDFLCAASSAGWKITGYEPNDKAKTLARNKNIELVDETASLTNESFDVITMWHVLEHVPDLNKQISELYRLLKPGGKIVIAVPNFKSFDAKYYKQFWAGYDVPRHLWHFSRTSIRKIFEEHNLFLTAVEPLTFDSYYVSLLSEKYKTGTMNPIKAFWIGFRSNFNAMNTQEYSSQIYILKKSV